MSELRAPRQGDSDDGRALVLGPPEANRWAGLLALGRPVFGAPDWWPAAAPDAMSMLVASMAGLPSADGTAAPTVRATSPTPGLTIMRSAPSHGPEIWCRCDAGPHGFLSIAAHAHADALAIEVRHGGVDVLADPGTYCYSSEPALAELLQIHPGAQHLEIAGQDQSTLGGPTLWITAGYRADVSRSDRDPDGRVTRWSAEHDGYTVAGPSGWPRRTVRLPSAGETRSRSWIRSETDRRPRAAPGVPPRTRRRTPRSGALLVN